MALSVAPRPILKKPTAPLKATPFVESVSQTNPLVASKPTTLKKAGVKSKNISFEITSTQSNISPSKDCPAFAESGNSSTPNHSTSSTMSAEHRASKRVPVKSKQNDLANAIGTNQPTFGEPNQQGKWIGKQLQKGTTKYFFWPVSLMVMLIPVPKENKGEVIVALSCRCSRQD